MWGSWNEWKLIAKQCCGIKWLTYLCMLWLQISKQSELIKKLQDTLSQCHYDLDMTRRRGEDDVSGRVHCQGLRKLSSSLSCLWYCCVYLCLQYSKDWLLDRSKWI